MVGMQRPAKQTEVEIHVVMCGEQYALAAAVRRFAASVMWAQSVVAEQPPVMEDIAEVVQGLPPHRP